MKTRLRTFLIILALLCAGNVAWHVWKGWGLVTLDANDRPMAEVLHSIERQAGVHLASNVPADAKVTIHVHKVHLLRALNVLAAAANANWSLAYFVAADKPSIERALATFSKEDAVEGWKHFALPQTRGMGYEPVSSDPREDRWDIHPASDSSLHSYLDQGSASVYAEFWAPEAWNPAVSSIPHSANVSKVLPKLAKSAHGASAEVFLFNKAPQFPRMTGGTQNGSGNGQSGQSANNLNFLGGRGLSDEMRKAMEQRMEAQMAKLPPEKRAKAQADLEARKKFFAELAALPPEQRKAKLMEAMEHAMDASKGNEMEAQSMQRGSMMTADQRNDQNRQIIAFKNTLNQ